MNSQLELVFDLKKSKHVKFVSKFTNKRIFVKEFRRRYNFIRAYHATNLSVVEIEDVRLNGLRIPSREFLKQKALLRFCKPGDPSSLKASISSAADEYFGSDSYFFEPKIFFGLIRAPFIENWYHYLLLGSEHLLPLADRLCSQHSIRFRERMRDSGKHCIIEATVPLSLVRNLWIESIYSYVKEGWDEANLILNKPLLPQFFQISFSRRPYDRHGFGRM